MAHTDSRNVSLPFVLFCLGIFFCDPAVAREKPWYKYENSHFEAYSNENERVTRKLLLKLENFRAAGQQARRPLSSKAAVGQEQAKNRKVPSRYPLVRAFCCQM